MSAPGVIYFLFFVVVVIYYLGHNRSNNNKYVGYSQTKVKKVTNFLLSAQNFIFKEKENITKQEGWNNNFKGHVIN